MDVLARMDSTNLLWYADHAVKYGRHLGTFRINDLVN